jgi:ABC-type sugar transport system ATPase subunit
VVVSLSGVLLRVENVSKYFGAVKALENISFEVKQGEILGIVGDNGAGKSTLLKIIAGALQPTSGEIYFEGRKVRFKDTSDAMKAGIAIAHQLLHEQLVDIRRVWENFFAGKELVKKVGLIEILDIKRMKTQTEEALKNYGLNIDVDRKIKQLSGGQRRLVTILRAFLSKENTKLILLDEIYIGLSPRMLEDLSKFLNNFLREHNISAIFAAQWLEQLMGIADRILVLRRGRIVGIFEAYSVDSETIYRLAIG